MKPAAKPAPKSQPAPEPAMGLGDYLAGELRGTVRRELVAGRRFVWPTPAGPRADILDRLGQRLREHLRTDASWVFTGGIRIQVEAADAVYYADAAVAVDPDYVEHTFVQAPLLIVDVFTGTRPGFDPKARLAQYQALHSLQQYVLLAPHRPQAVVHSRDEDGAWAAETLDGNGVLQLTSISLNFYLDEIYPPEL
jgi:Uma2 family endonuclease